MTEDIQHGKIYRIINWKSKTAIDLSVEDNTTATGSDVNDSANQKWLLEEQPSGQWTLQNPATGKYLGSIVYASALREGLKIKGVENKFEWQIVVDDDNEEGNRLYVPYTWYNLELYTDGGVPLSGVPLTLGKTVRPGEEQTWKFELVD